jgi:hypothetical protein
LIYLTFTLLLIPSLLFVIFVDLLGCLCL